MGRSHSFLNALMRAKMSRYFALCSGTIVGLICLIISNFWKSRTISVLFSQNAASSI
ncbi:hypothetical protein THIOM_000171 [Candidatus Thiomargarita nelsonii]|uniref:Uncharacterized protein n=1 Tax=Candidatus Thiomargarita nelsonii TaxID=1003181 RepID=A0A176S7Y6_9GAMM|nr:hypothetical protein THIOM_000171 [Candidatus Thiomargarita nelsonii]